MSHQLIVDLVAWRARLRAEVSTFSTREQSTIARDLRVCLGIVGEALAAQEGEEPPAPAWLIKVQEERHE